MKRKFPIDVQDDSLSSNDDKPDEENVSDWEDGNIRRSKRIKKVGLPRFFDHKFMKFDVATKEEYENGSNCWKDSLQETPATKKPRRKRLPKEPCESTENRRKKRISRAEKLEAKKALLKVANNSGVQCKGSMTENLHLTSIQEEPYTPPIVIPKLPETPQFSTDHRVPVTQLGQRGGESSTKDLLSEMSVWDFGLTGFPAFAPLKPVNGACVPEDGDKKLLELGAVKKVDDTIKIDNTIKTNTSKMESMIHIKAPPKRNGIIAQNFIPVNIPSSIDTASKRERQQPPQPGPSTLFNRVFPSRQDRTPRLITRVVQADPRNMMIFKTEMTKLNLPVHRIPKDNVMFKRKVHLPARPLSIPIVKNQDIPVFENTSWAKHPLTERAVLYIPSGTPTITIPSVAAHKEENTLTVL